MEWGYPRRGERLHVLAEDAPEGAPYMGVALCGAQIVAIVCDPDRREFWPVCQRCETLLSAMESV